MSATGGGGWRTYQKLVPIPAEAYDVGARKIPEDFYVRDLPNSPVKNRAMDMEQSSPPPHLG